MMNLKTIFKEAWDKATVEPVDDEDFPVEALIEAAKQIEKL